MKRFCLALDLQDDPQLIAEYVEHHRKVWPEVSVNIIEAGILDMEIYLVGNRMFMIMETRDDFTFEAMAAADTANPRVQDWEKLMWKYQKALPQAMNGEKWMLMERIYSLEEAKAQLKRAG